MVKAPPPPLERIESNSILVRRQFKAERVVKVQRPPAYYHSGDSGDIIYSMLWVQQRGGGSFYIGPDTVWETNSRKNQAIYKWLLPLIAVQPYIKRAGYAEKRPEVITHDLNTFRELWMNPGMRERHRMKRLFEAYPIRFMEPPVPEDIQWIFVQAIEIPDRPVVIHRSPRYRNPDFPWPEVVRRYSGKMLFIGLRSEYDEWVRTYGEHAEYRAVEDALDMAKLIAGAKLFIGNQSFPMSVALATNRPVIQETCTESQDCIFARSNAQYFSLGNIKWPKFGRRFVVPVPDANGYYELGPCEGANGIGDTLTITPLIRKLCGKAILNLPPDMAHIAPLLTNVCPVRFTDDYPVFKHFSSGGAWHMAEAKLRAFGRWPADIIPWIEITDEEKAWAKETLKLYENPIVFVPTCKREWAHVRQRDPSYWEPYIDALCMGYRVLQFGLPDYQTVGQAKRMSGFSIRQIAVLYQAIGRYVGVDTGDVHMMIGVGGSTLALVPPEQEGYRPNEWYYRIDRARYILFDDDRKIDDAIEDLLMKA